MNEGPPMAFLCHFHRSLKVRIKRRRAERILDESREDLRADTYADYVECAHPGCHVRAWFDRRVAPEKICRRIEHRGWTKDRDGYWCPEHK